MALLTPASTLGALLIRALPFEVPSSGVFLVLTWGLGGRRVGKFTVSVSILPQGRADDGLTAMDRFLFWLGIGAAQKSAGSKPRMDRRNWVVSLVIGTLITALMIVGMFLLLISQKL